MSSKKAADDDVHRTTDGCSLTGYDRCRYISGLEPQIRVDQNDLDAAFWK